MMKSICTWTWGFILFLAVGPALASQPPGPAPEAVFSQPSYQFESALDGQGVTHDFIVHNKGGADLEILKIKTG